MLSNARVPVIGFVAPSGSGKTTLLRYVLALLTEQGLRVGVVKQARADFDVDQPGKDSYELRKAGVERLLLGSERQSALMMEHPDAEEPDLNALLDLFDQTVLDLILVEGFSDYPFPKIELYRCGGRPPRYPYDNWVIAVATDDDTLPASLPVFNLPVFNLDDCWAIAEFVAEFIADQAASAAKPIPEKMQS